MTLRGFGNLEPLGSGGVGDVFRATRISTGSIVAIKVLRDWSDEKVAWQRAQRELRALVDLQGHPNVVHVEEVLDVDGVPYLVMEYAPGGSVADYQRSRGGRLSIPEVVMIAEQTASALAASHQRGIVHLDIKPQNLLIGSFGQIKVCDFGIAALTQTDTFLERTDAFSVNYASPEQLDGATVGPAADIYALGATAVHLLTGASPSIRTRLLDPDATLQSWQPDTDVPADVVDRLGAFLRRCQAPDPGQRPAAAACVDELERLAASLGDRRCRSLAVAPGAAPRRPTAIPGDDALTIPRAGLPLTGPGATDATVIRPAAVAEPERTEAVAVGASSAGASRRSNRTLLVGLVVLAALAGAIGSFLLLGGDSDSAEGGDDDRRTTVAGDDRDGDRDRDQADTTEVLSPPTPSAAPAVVAPTTTPVDTATPVETPATAAVEPVLAPAPAEVAPAPAAAPTMTSVSASAVRSNSEDACGNPTTYQPPLAVDGLNDTAWMVTGDGSGAVLTIELTEPSVVQEVGLIPGYDKFDPCTGRDRFFELRRVTAVRWTFDDGSSLDQMLSPTPELQTISVGRYVVSSRVTMTIVSTTAPGDERLDHTPVSEVVVR